MFSVILFCIPFYMACFVCCTYVVMGKRESGKITEKKRIRWYQFSFSWSTVSGLSVIVLVKVTPITWEQIGLNPVGWYIGEYPFVLLGGILICAWLLHRNFVVESLDGNTQVKSGYDHIASQLIPRTGWEKEWFLIMALGAGGGEELVLRGFFLYILKANWRSAPDILLVMIVGIGFGAANLYQGSRGMVKTGILGVLSGLVYIGTRSVYVCMLIRFLVEISFVLFYGGKETA